MIAAIAAGNDLNLQVKNTEDSQAYQNRQAKWSAKRQVKLSFASHRGWASSAAN